MLLVIDNYDSFTYNLYQMLAKLNYEMQVFRNDKITIKEIQKLKPKAIIISPGPGTPKKAGICVPMIKKLAPEIPIFGVCLGLQAIVEAFGGKVVRAGTCVHGKPSWIFHRRRGIFEKMPLPFEAGRYHSLIVESQSLPKDLIVEADSADGLIMAVSHVKYPTWGVQFHPESILTDKGELLLKNFMQNIAQTKVS